MAMKSPESSSRFLPAVLAAALMAPGCKGKETEEPNERKTLMGAAQQVKISGDISKIINGDAANYEYMTGRTAAESLGDINDQTYQCMFVDLTAESEALTIITDNSRKFCYTVFEPRTELDRSNCLTLTITKRTDEQGEDGFFLYEPEGMTSIGTANENPYKHGLTPQLIERHVNLSAETRDACKAEVVRSHTQAQPTPPANNGEAQVQGEANVGGTVQGGPSVEGSGAVGGEAKTETPNRQEI